MDGRGGEVRFSRWAGGIPPPSRRGGRCRLLVAPGGHWAAVRVPAAPRSRIPVSLELWKIMLNSKFDASNVQKNSLEFNTVCRARGKEFCSHSTIQGIKLWQVLCWPTVISPLRISRYFDIATAQRTHGSAYAAFQINKMIIKICTHVARVCSRRNLEEIRPSYVGYLPSRRKMP